MLPEDPEEVPELEPPSEPVEDEPLVLEPPDEEPLEAAKAGAPASMSADIRTATCADFIVHFLHGEPPFWYAVQTQKTAERR